MQRIFFLSVCFLCLQIQTPQTRSRAHESPPPTAKRRRSSPTQERNSPLPNEEDSSLDEHADMKRDIRVSLVVFYFELEIQTFKRWNVRESYCLEGWMNGSLCFKASFSIFLGEGYVY